MNFDAPLPHFQTAMADYLSPSPTGERALAEECRVYDTDRRTELHSHLLGLVRLAAEQARRSGKTAERYRTVLDRERHERDCWFLAVLQAALTPEGGGGGGAA